MKRMINCFDVVSMVIEDVKSECGNKIDDEKLDILKEYCEALDTCVDRFEIESVDAEIEDNDNRIRMVLKMPDLTVEDKNDVIYQLIERSYVFNIKQANDGDLLVTLEFPSVFC